MSNTTKVVQAKASSVKKGGFIVINGRPCKVVEMSTSKTGKHGSAKVHFVALDIFTNKKMEELSPSTHNVDVPEVSRIDYQLIDISDDGYAALLLDDGSTKNDLKVLDGEVGDKIRTDFSAGSEVWVTVQSAMGQEMIMTSKATKES